MTKNSKKPLVAVFAHPDDEAFSSAGTLAKYAKTREVYLICVTNGNDHTRPRPHLVEIRKAELKNSARAIGTKKVYFLGYEDGNLSNNIYHDVAKKIERIINRIKPDTLLTMENRGISGHIDHIFVSMVTSFVFKRSKFAKILMYSCMVKEFRKKMGDDYFIYVPEGYDKKETDLVVNVEKTWRQKVEAIKSHKSQFKDVDRLLKNFDSLPKLEYFLVKRKK